MLLNLSLEYTVARICATDCPGIIIDRMTELVSLGDFVVDRPGGAQRGAGPLLDSEPLGAEEEDETSCACAGDGVGLEWDDIVVKRRNTGQRQATNRGRRTSSRVTATVGGVDYSVGGWGEYEATRRVAEREARLWGVTGGSSRSCGCSGDVELRVYSEYYPGRKFVGGRDVAESLLVARPPRALAKAAEHLATSLGDLEDTLCDPDDDSLWECASPSTLHEPKGVPKTFPSIVVPSLTSDDVRTFMSKRDFTSPDELYAIANDAISTAASVREVIKPPPSLKGHGVPPLPARTAPTNDDAAVAKLEAAAIPYVNHVEELQSAVASILDRTAAAIDRALVKNRG